PAPAPQQSANSGANVGGANTAPAAAPAAPAAAPAAPAAPAAAAPAAAAPAPAAAAAPAATASAVTMTAVLDNVGAAQFRMSKGIWPDVMFHGYYGFLEPMLGWNEAYDENGNPIVDRSLSDSCAAPHLITSWEWDLPATAGGTVTQPGLDLDLSVVNLDDPDNQGVMRWTVREGVDFYMSDDGAMKKVGPMTAKDIAWSANDAGSDNTDTSNSNSSQAFENYKRWDAVSDYVGETPARAFTADGLQDFSSECWDAVFVTSKQIQDDYGDSFGIYHGTGPFVVHDWKPSERIEAESRVDHWKNSPAFDKMVYLQANEAQQRSAMLQTGLADIGQASIQDVGKLESEGFVFNAGMDAIIGNFFFFAGNFWSYTDPVNGGEIIRDGFKPSDKYPWIGDPRVECEGIDRSDPAIQDTPGAGCTATGFDYSDTERFSYETTSMENARNFRKALALSIDRQLIADSVTGGWGSPIYGGGSSWGVPIHQLHPEYKAKWDVAFDPDLAAEHLALSGVPEGFEFEFFCSQGNGTSLEVCEAVTGQWRTNLGLNPVIDSSQYSSRRPTMLGRQIHVPWMTKWGPTSKQGRLGSGGGTWGGGNWPIASGGYNPGLEDNAQFDHREATRKMEKGSQEQLDYREAIMDFGFHMQHAVGTVQVPLLYGVNPDTIGEWKLRPIEVVNSFDTIVPAN
ncbi:MAG: ABC transporter substrate-binding protein, partial [Dehalococcoidia bacterium]